jgi:hypothetical protein
MRAARPPASIAVVALVLLAPFAQARFTFIDDASAEAPESVDCRPALSRDQVVKVALEVMGLPSEEALLEDYEVSVRADGCDYVFFAQLHEPLAVEPILLIIDRSGRVVNPPTCWWLGDLGNCSFPFEGEPLPLESLNPRCVVQKAWAGLPPLPYGAWLTCTEAQPVLIPDPLSLLGKVHVESEEEAIAYVRFFSSPHTYDLFRMDGMLDVALVAESWSERLAGAAEAKAIFRPPQVVSATDNSFCVDERGGRQTCSRTTFTITRRAAFYDGGIYEVTEELSEDGAYRIVAKKLLLKGVQRFGIHHDPPKLPDE